MQPPSLPRAARRAQCNFVTGWTNVYNGTVLAVNGLGGSQFDDRRRKPPGGGANTCGPGADNDCVNASDSERLPTAPRAIAYRTAVNDRGGERRVLAERREPPGSGANSCGPGADNACVEASDSERLPTAPRAIAYCSAVNDRAGTHPVFSGAA